MLRVFCTNRPTDDRLPELAQIGSVGDIDAQADAAVSLLLRMPVGSRGLYVRDISAEPLTKPEAVKAGGWPIAKGMQRWVGVFNRLKSSGIKPDIAFIEEDSALSPYIEGVAGILPGPIHVQARLAAAIVTQAISDIFCAAGEAVYGESIPTVRYGDLVSIAPQFDGNGADLPRESVQGYSNPDVYNAFGGRHSKGGTLNDVDAHWRAFCDSVDRLRCSVNPVPVIAPASYQGDDHKAPKHVQYLWREKLRHALASGVTTAIYWNPPTLAQWAKEDDAALLDVLKIKPTKPSKALGRISMSDQSVTTGRVKTTYAAYSKIAGTL